MHLQTLFRFVMPLAILAFAQSGEAGQLKGCLTLAGNQRLPVRIESVQDGVWQITSPLFHGYADVPVSIVQAVVFDGPQKIDTDEMFRFELRSGEFFVGRLLSLNGRFCSIRHFDLGVIKVDSRQLVGAIRITKDQRVFSAADLPDANSKASASGSGTMRLLKDHSFTSPFNLIKGSAMSVLFRTQADTEFRILLKSAGQTVVAVQVSADGVMAESAESLEFGDIEIQPGIEQFTFVVAEKQLSIRNRLGVEFLKVSCKCDDAPSVEIVNDSARLEIIQARVETAHQPVKIGKDQTGNILVLNKAGKSFASDDVTVGDGEVVFADKRISVDDLQSIHFRKRSFSQRSLSPACVLWADGSRMAISRFESRASKLFMENERIFGKQLAEVSSPQAAFFTDESVKRPSVANHELLIGDAQYSGTFQWGDAKRPLRWQFDGFKNPVALMMNRRIELSGFTGRRKIDLTGLDRLVLTNGTILPCQILSIGKDGVHFRSPYCQIQKIPVNQFRACFFASGFEQGNTKAITKESMQRMLMIPRFSRDLEPEHVLMSVTGDLLRGTLLSMGDKAVAFDSRAEVLRIDRQRISGIVRLQGTGNEAVDRQEDKGKASVSAVALNYGNDFVVVGELQGSGTQLQVNVPGCGLCQLPKQGVKSVQANADRAPLSPLYRYANLNPVASLDPRWTLPPAPNVDAAKLKGKSAPDVTLTTLDGSEFCVSDHRGKVVVLDFWASWCQPCVMGMPEYLKAIQEFSEGDVIFVAVNHGETGSTVENFQKKMQWDTNLLLDTQGQAAKQYSVNAIPHLVVIDPVGNVAEVSIGYHPDSAAKLNGQIRNLLSGNTNE